MFAPKQTGEQRLRAWRNLRHNSNIAVPQDVVDYFSLAPLKPRYIDFYTPENWPTVFEIVQEGMFCYSGVCLVLASTLWYFKFTNQNNLHFDVISNHVTGDTGLVLVDENQCYNFLPGEIVCVEHMKKNSTLYDSHIIAPDKVFS